MVLIPARPPLRPMGRLSRTDASGHLPRLGRAPMGPLGGQLGAFARALADHLPAGVSVVLRGSLARGASTAADVDLMLIAPETVAPPPLHRLPPLPLPVEMSVVPTEILLHDCAGAWPRFALAHCGWTLAGPDHLPDLPEPKLDRTAIAHLKGVRRWWPRRPLDWGASMALRRLILQWLAKRILRSLAEGEMVRRGLYSRDIWPCLQVAAHAHPAASTALTRVAEQAVSPNGHPATFARLTRTTRPLLERAYLRHMGRPLQLPV